MPSITSFQLFGLHHASSCTMPHSCKNLSAAADLADFDEETLLNNQEMLSCMPRASLQVRYEGRRFVYSPNRPCYSSIPPYALCSFPRLQMFIYTFWGAAEAVLWQGVCPARTAGITNSNCLGARKTGWIDKAREIAPGLNHSGFNLARTPNNWLIAKQIGQIHRGQHWPKALDWHVAPLVIFLYFFTIRCQGEMQQIAPRAPKLMRTRRARVLSDLNYMQIHLALNHDCIIPYTTISSFAKTLCQGFDHL